MSRLPEPDPTVENLSATGRHPVIVRLTIDGAWPWPLAPYRCQHRTPTQMTYVRHVLPSAERLRPND